MRKFHMFQFSTNTGKKMWFFSLFYGFQCKRCWIWKIWSLEIYSSNSVGKKSDIFEHIIFSGGLPNNYSFDNTFQKMHYRSDSTLLYHSLNRSPHRWTIQLRLHKLQSMWTNFVSIWSTEGPVHTCFFSVCFSFFLHVLSFEHLIEEREWSHSVAS